MCDEIVFSRKVFYKRILSLPCSNRDTDFEEAETGRWWKFCFIKQGGTEIHQEDGIIGRL